MDAVLLDTDVFSFFFKGDTRAEMYTPDVEGKQMCLSFMSVAELLRWTIVRGWGEPRRRSLEQALRRCVVLPYDAAMAQAWATIAVQRSRSGHPIACGDCWIAAAAIRHDVPLITHNAKDFSGVDRLRVITRA